MAFPLENILTMSAQDYVGPGKSVREEYHVQGVLWKGQSSKLLDGFAHVVPEKTEVVVDVRVAFSGTNYSDNVIGCISGTALIPKD